MVNGGYGPFLKGGGGTQLAKCCDRSDGGSEPILTNAALCSNDGFLRTSAYTENCLGVRQNALVCKFTAQTRSVALFVLLLLSKGS